VIGRLFIWLIRGYQKYISPVLPSSCKYRPTCSEYAIDAVSKYGAFKGFFMAVLRILRCNPFSKGGYDPVK